MLMIYFVKGIVYITFNSFLPFSKSGGKENGSPCRRMLILQTLS